MSSESVQDIIAQVATSVAAEKTKKEEVVQVIVFVLDNEEYAVLITDLQEIITIPTITPLPNAPAFISGIFNLRGKIIVVMDLEKRFSLVREHAVPFKHMVISEVGGTNFGIMVDQVKEVLRVPRAGIQEAPALVSTKIHSDYLKGVIVLGQGKGSEKSVKRPAETNDTSRLIIMLDLPKLLQEKELLNLGDTIKQATKS